MDWIDSDLPFEGTIREETLGFLADRSVPTCRSGELAAAARGRVADRRPSAVLNEDGVLLGLLADDGDGPGRVIDRMREAPSTYRPHVTAEEVLPQVERRRLDDVIVTTLEGRLVGFVSAETVRSAAASARPTG